MITVPMRLKEDADDYRYIPDPDLPPMKIDPAHVEEIRAKMPEPAHLKTARLVEEYGIDDTKQVENNGLNGTIRVYQYPSPKIRGGVFR
jgi:Asp-tRNA(Asn)/Glu-tRNA(Gln) amidotransferase B subunit